MNHSVITVVADPPGVGKTSWIRQQMAQSHKPGLYFSPATDVLIDQTRLAIEVPKVKILFDSHQFQLLALKDEISAYIEPREFFDVVDRRLLYADFVDRLPERDFG